MSQQLLLQIQGLKTNPSPLVQTPGNLLEATNINIDSPNTATCRRGMKKYVTAPLLLGTKLHGFYEFKNKILVHCGTYLAHETSSDGSTWVEYGNAVSAVDNEIGIRAVNFNGSMYFNLITGVKKIAAVADATYTDAGGIKAISGTGVLTGASGFLSENCQVAYRVVWAYKDANNIIVYGAPSERIEVIQSLSAGSTRNIALTIYIPSGVTTNYFFQIYRSKPSASEDTTANDELYLVYESYPTSGEITAGSISITDIVPDSLMGATIYTAPSQEGIAGSNDVPPLCHDMTVYKNCVLYANTKTKHRKFFTIIAVGGSTGIAVNDTITIGATTYTAKATENAAAAQFLADLVSSTVAEQIANTAKSLVKVINTYASNTIYYAFYMSGYDELPGKIMIERRDLLDAALAFTASAHSKAYSPNLPTSGITVVTEAETKPNRIYISKPYQAEAVPLTNYLDAGSESYEIRRIIALRDSVFIFKEDGEIYRLTGEDINSFQITLFDNTVKLFGARTAVVLNNQIYCFSNQGVVAISDSGVEIKSWPIEDQLKAYLSTDTTPNFKTTAFGIAYESDRKYILCDGTYEWVYNILVNSWTKWSIAADSGFVFPYDDKLYIADSSRYVWKERKALTKFDYADESFAVTIVSYSGYDIVLSSLTNVAVDQSIQQTSAYKNAKITAINTGTNTITVNRLASWTAGAATIYKPIECKMQWLQITGNNPGLLKRFRECTVMFREMNSDFDISFSNDFNGFYEVTNLSPAYLGYTWATWDWGEVTWDGATGSSQEKRTYFPLKYQRGKWVFVRITTKEAFTKFSLDGLSVLYETIDSRSQE